MLANIPLMIIPLVVYNLQIFLGNANIWPQNMFTVNMISGEAWTMTVGDLMVCAGLLLLFFEILKATRISATSIVDHLLSTFVFIAYLVEFLLVPQAAHTVFFLLMVIALVDVLAGFSVSIRSATRDVTFGSGGQY